MSSINPDYAIRAAFEVAPPPARSPWAVGVSVLLHVVAIAGVTGLAAKAALDQAKLPQKPLTFVSLALAPRAAIEYRAPIKMAPLVEPKIELPAPPPVVEEKPIVEPPKPEPKIETPAPQPKPVEPPKPQVVVGAFNTPTVAANTQPQRQVQATGFDSQASVNQATRPNTVAAVGAFDAIEGGRKPGGQTTAAVAPGGFDQAGSAGGRTTPRGGVVTTAFDSGAGGAGGSRPAQPAVVKASGFGDVQQEVKREASKAVASTVTPVEVTFKPTPQYTDEARAKQIQGEVILEVEFSATGGVKVLRVVKGLGYGLDDMAKIAASQMKFKPATEQGRPVDFKANVQIVFRLT